MIAGQRHVRMDPLRGQLVRACEHSGLASLILASAWKFLGGRCLYPVVAFVSLLSGLPANNNAGVVLILEIHGCVCALLYINWGKAFLGLRF
ncbi:hypothetical protein T4E_6000 [Trichinella pseudospiralis]|uniref:Uncharacterized protein n=1 Tax=Trichinella pseudospiralis TaxID=6337 RepID=A0A0V0YLI5_TRIPS|nr:hypothetical protein T4E_6000 [Trichinella pseudospiralis]